MSAGSEAPGFRRGRWALGVLVALAALSVSAVPAQAAPAVSCRYIEAGPAGDAGNELLVRIRSDNWAADITSDGTALTVASLPLISGGTSAASKALAGTATAADAVPAGTGRRVLSCASGDPTTTNIDRILIASGGRTSAPSVLFRIARGPLGPGATDEGPGNSEIEVEFETGDGLFLPIISVLSGSGDDRFLLGRSQGADAVNLNPDEPQPDVDILSTGPLTIFAFATGPGSDVVDGRGGPGFGAPLSAFMFARLGRGDDRLRGGPRSVNIGFGGPGNDRLRGGRGLNLLSGGLGRDVLLGGRGPDHIAGGPQRDLIRGRRGDDSINSADGRFDLVRCGPGQDVLAADRRDPRRGCERVRRRGRAR